MAETSKIYTVGEALKQIADIKGSTATRDALLSGFPGAQSDAWGSKPIPLNEIYQRNFQQWKSSRSDANSLDQLATYQDQMTALQKLAQNGQMKVSDYYNAANQIVPKIQQAQSDLTNFIQYANPSIKNTVWPTNQTGLQNFLAPINSSLSGFMQQGANGQMVPTMPFSAKDYLNLPNELLPTQEDIQKGIVPMDALPMGKLQTVAGQPTTPATTLPVTPPATAPGTQTPFVPATPGQPNPAVNQPPQIDPTTGLALQPDQLAVAPPNVPPPPTAPSIDQQTLSNEATREQADYMNALNQALGITTNATNEEAQALGGQEAYLKNALSQAMAQRQGTWTDYSKLLQQQNENAMTQMTPDVLESLNSRGLMTSSALGNALAQERAKLQTNSTNQLAQMGLDTSNYAATSGMDIANQMAGLQQALAQQKYGLSQGYAAGLIGNVANTSSLNQAGIQRQFSLADWQREAALAKELGSTNTPQVNNSGNPLMGAAAGAGTGYMIGGPVGAMVGGGVGLLAGSQGGGK